MSWGNSKTVIRNRKQGPNKATAFTAGILDDTASSYTFMWADAKNGKIRLGYGQTIGMNEILEWTDPSPHDVTRVGIMTGWGASGIVKFMSVHDVF